MKILNIYFKNINSLEGENRINFTQPPISDTGVFAITGANGSGKSSILDAITLGLYGETFRFDRPASFVMTKNTAECFATVEFQLKDSIYQSSWYVQRTDADPQGEIQPPQMQLTCLDDGTLLADNQQQVCKQIAELTGMNFRNFTRSILLAQGDFAAFLNALDSERMDILEKIVSTDIYAEYKKDITDKTEQAQKNLAALTQQLAAINLLAPEQLSAYRHDLIDFNERYEELQVQRQHLQQQQSAVDAVGQLHDQLADVQNRIRTSDADIEKVQAQLEQITASQGVLLFKDDVIAVAGQQQSFSDNKAALAALSGELEQLKKHLGDNNQADVNLDGKSFAAQRLTIDELHGKVNQARSNQQSEMALWQSLVRQITEKKSTIGSITTWLEAHAADEALLADFPETGKLKKLRAELIELTEKQKLFAKQNKKASSSQKNNHAALDQANKQKIELEQQLKNEQQELAELFKSNTVETLTALRSEQQERVTAFQQLRDLALAHKKLTKTGSGWFRLVKEEPKIERDTGQLAIELEQLTETLKREENIKLALEQARINEALIKKLTADRHHLVDGKPCPLCGALQHPYAKRLPVFSDSLKAVADQQLKIRNLTATAERLKQQIEQSKKNSARNQAIAQRVQQLQGQWLGLCHRLNSVSAELDIENLPAMQVLLNAEIQELKEITALIDKCISKQTRIGKLKNLAEKNLLVIGQLQARTGKLDTDSVGQSQEYKDNATALAACQQEQQQLIARITGQLAVLGEKMPDKGKEDVLFDRLNARRQDYQSYVFRLKNLTGELAVLETKQADCQAEITHYNELIELYNEQLQKAEIVGLHLAIIEKQKLIADKDQALLQQQNQIRELQQDLQAKLIGSPFKTLEELQQLLALQAKQPELEARKADLQQVLAEQDAELEKINTLLAAQLPEDDVLPTPEQLAQQLRSNAEQLDIARLEARKSEKIIKEQEALQQQYAELADSLRQQQAITDASLAEVALLTAEHGMAFRRRVQAEIIGKLLSQTNALLEKISGRYYLRQKPSEQGLALEIEDTFQGNERRLPKTLSGGETFVISLALALGLCELANNGKAVDSLFIDEGFGNLDAETLYTVISTLESLQTYGKTVGVISHVEAVQKRFKAQLQVVKKANGMGELRRVS